MIVKILSANPRSAVGIGIITPSINARVWNIQWEEITEPVYTIPENPCFCSTYIYVDAAYNLLLFILALQLPQVRVRIRLAPTNISKLAKVKRIKSLTMYYESLPE